MLGDVIVPRRRLPAPGDGARGLGGSVIAVTPVEPRARLPLRRHRRRGGRAGRLARHGPRGEAAAEEAPSNLAIFGRYLLTPPSCSSCPRSKPGAGDEIQLTDALRELLGRERSTRSSTTDPGYDTGNMLAWLEANLALAMDYDDLGPALRASMRRLLADAE